MSEKPLCGYCYNECTDDCCDKRRIDVLERKLSEARFNVQILIGLNKLAYIEGYEDREDHNKKDYENTKNDKYKFKKQGK